MTLLSTVGLAFSEISIPTPLAVIPPKIVLFKIRPNGTDDKGRVPVSGSPLKRMPPRPEFATTLFSTFVPTVRRSLLIVGKLRTPPGRERLPPASRAPASTEIPNSSESETVLLAMSNCPCSRCRLLSPSRNNDCTRRTFVSNVWKTNILGLRLSIIAPCSVPRRSSS